MSYTPTIIIKKSSLDKALESIEEEQYSLDVDRYRVSKYLLEVSRYNPVKIDDTGLLLCTPEFSSFSCDVREMLTEFNVYFKLDN